MIVLADELLLEQCVVCGLVVRDDRAPESRLRKPHAHWMPSGNRYDGEVLLSWMEDTEIQIHATVCVEHLAEPFAWKAFITARTIMFEEYPQYVSELKTKSPSFNCSLSRLMPLLHSHKFKTADLSALYDIMVTSMLESKFYELTDNT